jgi:hypothetical protein
MSINSCKYLPAPLRGVNNLVGLLSQPKDPFIMPLHYNYNTGANRYSQSQNESVVAFADIQENVVNLLKLIAHLDY